MGGNGRARTSRLAVNVLLVVLLTAMPLAPTRATTIETTSPGGAARVAVDIPAPVLVSPLGGTAARIDVEFSWQRVPGAAGYRLIVRKDGPSGPVHMDVRTVNDRHVGVANFAGATAWWEVSAVTSSGQEGPATAASFRTAHVRPTPLWPPDGAVLNHPEAGPDLVWDRVPGQAEGAVSDQDVGSTGPVVDAPGHLGLGAWRWQVSASVPGIAEPSAPRSDIRTFTYAWPEGAPRLLAPVDGLVLDVERVLRLEWDAVPGAAMYLWEFGIPGEEPAAYSSGSMATWADVPAWPNTELVPGTYEWRVRAVLAGTRQATKLGPWSEVRTLVVPSSLPVPATTYPGDGQVLAAWPLLRWEEVPGTRGYGVEVTDDPVATAPAYSPADAPGVFQFSPQDDPTESPLLRVAPGTVTRYWRVRGFWTAHGVAVSAWSPWQRFTVDPSDSVLDAETPAVPVAPVDCVSDSCPDLDGLPLLRWEPVPGAASYRVYVRWDGGTGPADATYDVGSPGLALPAYLATGQHRVAWAVLACPASGCGSGMPSDRHHFRVSLPVPEQTGPADGTVQAAPSVGLTWAPSPVPLHPDAVHRWLESEVELTIAGNWSQSTLDDPYFTIDAVEPGTTVTWRVRYYADLPGEDRVTGPWSPWRSVTRTEPPIALRSPAQGEVLQSTPMLDWDGLPYAHGAYQVQLVRLSHLPVWATSSTWGLETGASQARPPTLSPGEYRWRVRRVGNYFSGEGEGEWSTGTFVIAGTPAPQALAPASGATVRGDDVAMSWAPLPSLGALDHCIAISTDVAFAEDDVVYQGCSHPAATTHTLPVALQAGNLHWRVCVGPDCSPPRAITIQAAPNPAPLVSRYAGPTRFGTAAMISARSFATAVPVAFVANAFNFPDALAGAAAAGVLDGPVLLVAPIGPVHPDTVAELRRVQPDRIVVLGGTAMVSNAVQEELRRYTAGTVTRYAGPDRFATAATISARTFAPGVPVAFVANAFNFPDALAGAAAAGTLGGPVLLVAPTGPVHPATVAELTRLKPAKIVVLGGTAMVSSAVLNALKPYATGGTVTRYAGPDRFATAASVSANTFAPGVPVAFVANAYNFPDALAGAAAAGSLGGPVLLVGPTGPIHPATLAELRRLKPGRIVVLGGTAMVSDAVLTALRTTVSGIGP